tara:strand:- start:2493 stop:2633 length:141 start_codon:yes stop_codon:yes gene_type:complete
MCVSKNFTCSAGNVSSLAEDIAAELKTENRIRKYLNILGIGGPGKY